MNRLYRWACVVGAVAGGIGVAPTASAAGPGTIRVFLQGGQSNADGRAQKATLPAALLNPQADVPFYYYYENGPTTGGALGTLTTLRPGASETGANTFGPEVAFGRKAADAAAGAGITVAVIKYANGGTTLATNWKADGTASPANDGNDYKVFQTVVTNGLAALATANPGKTIELAGMTWVQGESDIDGGATTANAYGANLTKFIADVRATLGQPNLPFFLSRISDNQTVYSAGSATTQANYNTLRAAQAAVAAADPDTYMIDADGPEFGMNADNLHFNAAGQQAMGAAFADAAIAAGAVPEPGAIAVIAAGAVSLVGRRRRR